MLERVCKQIEGKGESCWARLDGFHATAWMMTFAASLLTSWNRGLSELVGVEVYVFIKGCLCGRKVCMP